MTNRRTTNWLDRIFATPRSSGSRMVYVVENQDWQRPESNLSDEQAYAAIVDLYNTVSDEQYKAAIAGLKDARPPLEYQP